MPAQQWREKGEMMDKRMARKVHGADFRRTLAEINDQLKMENSNNAKDIPLDATNRRFRVYTRKRPIFPHELKKKEYDVVVGNDRQTIVIHDCQMYADMKNKYIESHSLKFDRVFDENASNKEVYMDAVQSLVHHVLQGGMAACMMYGQTGSGKTHTMQGMQQHIIDEIFSSPETANEFPILLTVVEITGTECYDLLHQRRRIRVCEDENGNVHLRGAKDVPIRSSEEFIEVVRNANQERATEATMANETSSRSHCAIRVTLQQNDESKGVYGQLWLLDLAGSERNENSLYHSADRRKETSEINSSHLALKQCFRALCGQSEFSNGFIPYRNSLLTRVLKDCFWSSSTSQVALIATISPTTSDTEHSLHVLNYASLLGVGNNTSKVQRTEVVFKMKVELENVKNFDSKQMVDWISKLRRGTLAKYTTSIGSNVDGKQFSRFALPRLTQLLDGNAADAKYLYDAFRDDIKKYDAAVKAKREGVQTRARETPKGRSS